MFGCNPLMRLRKARSARCWFALPMMLGMLWHFTLWVLRGHRYVDVVWDNNFQRTLAANNVDGFISTGKTDPKGCNTWKSRSSTINTHQHYNAKRFTVSSKNPPCPAHHLCQVRVDAVSDGPWPYWASNVEQKSNFENQHHSTQLGPAKCDISSLLLLWRPSTCPPIERHESILYGCT